MGDCLDVVGIGFGPANLALAVALHEQGSDLTVRFVEQQADPVWQGAMLLPSADIQNNPIRDLVTLRNPRSRYSFLNYLFEHGRLLAFLNLPAKFPLRKEYAGYVRWVTRQFEGVVDFGEPVTAVDIEPHQGEAVYRVTLGDGRCHLARAVVVSTGRTPLIPAQFAGADRSVVFHSNDYLPRVRTLATAPRAVAVIGGSQSAVEITLDLARRFPGARVTIYTRSYSLRAKDTSPFSEEGYFPAFTDYYWNASRASKRTLDAYMRPTNYSASDADVLDELYTLMYEQQLDGERHLFVEGNREVRRTGTRRGRTTLEIAEVHGGSTVHDEVDLVVLATGFRDIGPGPDDEPFPALLRSVADRFRFDEHGYLVVNSDYSLSPVGDAPPLFLNGLCESTHGIGDAGSFSLLSLRAATICDMLTKRRLAGPWRPVRVSGHPQQPTDQTEI